MCDMAYYIRDENHKLSFDVVACAAVVLGHDVFTNVRCHIDMGHKEHQFSVGVSGGPHCVLVRQCFSVSSVYSVSDTVCLCVCVSVRQYIWCVRHCVSVCRCVCVLVCLCVSCVGHCVSVCQCVNMSSASDNMCLCVCV